LRWNRLIQVFVCIAIFFVAQYSTAQGTYQSSTLSKQKTKEAVNSASKGVDFSDEQLAKPKEKKKNNGSQNGKEGNGRNSNSSASSGMGGTVPLFAKVLLILLALGLIIFIVLGIIKTRGSSAGNLSYDAETDEFAKLNLQDPLEEQLGKGNYRLACRILYLQLLQDLVKLRAILWRNEKTNWDYYNEALTSKKIHHDKLHTITDKYDYLWYGEQEPNLDEFERFKILINGMRA
jgi:hypothetical protein